MYSAIQLFHPHNLDGRLIVLVNAELLRENKRMLEKSIREIERERQGLQAQEKKLINEIKKVAKQGQMVRATSLLLNSQRAFVDRDTIPSWHQSNLKRNRSTT